MAHETVLILHGAVGDEHSGGVLEAFDAVALVLYPWPRDAEEKEQTKRQSYVLTFKRKCILLLIHQR